MNTKFDFFLTSQLLAKYIETSDREYASEYIRRLLKLGFTQVEAKQLSKEELWKLSNANKNLNLRILTASDLTTKKVFQQNKSVCKGLSVENMMKVYLLSYLVVIEDEARNSETIHLQLPQQLYQEIQICNSLQYRQAMMDYYLKTVGIDRLHLIKFIQAEEQLLFKLKWGNDIPHPYN